jgi:hypothetical protein
MQTRRRWLVAHFVLVATVSLLTLVWCAYLLASAGPWHPHFAGGAIELGGPRGIDGIASAFLLILAIFALGALAAYVLVTSLVAVAVRGHWSVLVLDVLVPFAVVAFFLVK